MKYYYLHFLYFELTQRVLNFNTAFTTDEKKGGGNSTRLIYQRIKMDRMEKKFFENEFLLYFHRGEIIEINNRLVQRSPRHRLLMVKRCSRSITTENE